MRGGCFGKILTFIFGVVVGVVLLAGTLAGAVYYVATQVTVADVEDIAGQRFIPNDDAEIRSKTLYGIYQMIVGGDIKNITVKGIYDTFGFDIIEIIENAVEIEIDDASRAELEALPVLQVFQGDNLRIVLNCLTLDNVLTKAGIDKTNIEDKPLFADRLDLPVIDAFNDILGVLDFNTLTIGEMEYLLGMSLGEGILDNLRGYTVNELNSALEDITVEKLIPDFDRDYYFLQGDTVYYLTGYEAVEFLPAYRLIDITETIPSSERFNVTDDGLAVQNDEGTWTYANGKPAIYETYAVRTGGTIEKDANGAFVCAVPAAERYTVNDQGQYVQDNEGLLYRVFSQTGSGTQYKYSYVKHIVDGADGQKVLEKRGLRVYEGGYNELYYIKNTSTTADPSYTLSALEDGVTGVAVYEFAYAGSTERILQTLADMTLNTINADIGSITIGDVMTVDENSSNLLKELKDTPIGELSEKIDNTKLSVFIDIKATADAEANALGEYISLPDGNDYIGSFTVATVDEREVKLVKWSEDIDGAFFAGQTRYNIVTPASSGILAAIAEMTVLELQTGMQSVIDNATLGGVLEINGDVYMHLGQLNYEGVAATVRADAYVFADQNGDVMRTIDEGDTQATDVYQRIYVGGDSAIIKKMWNIKIVNIGSRIQSVVDETRLSEILTVQEEYIIRAATEGELSNDAIHKYKLLDEGTEYFGTFNVGRVLDGGTLSEPRVFVRADTADSGTKYVVETEISSGILTRLANSKIGDLTMGMQQVVNETKLSDVLLISGDVYVKLGATEYGAAVVELAAATDKVDDFVYYLDDSGLFLKAGYIRATDGAYVYATNEAGEEVLPTEDGGYIAYDATMHADWQRYTANGVSSGEFYKKIYSGKSDIILKKLATITAGGLGSSGTINKAVNDSTLGDLGITPASDDGSILYRIGDYRIAEIDYAVSDVIADSTVNDINTWGKLGMDEGALRALNILNYRRMVQTPNLLYNGNDPRYNLKTVDFFRGLYISVAPTSGNVTIEIRLPAVQ